MKPEKLISIAAVALLIGGIALTVSALRPHRRAIKSRPSADGETITELVELRDEELRELKKLGVGENSKISLNCKNWSATPKELTSSRSDSPVEAIFFMNENGANGIIDLVDSAVLTLDHGKVMAIKVSDSTVIAFVSGDAPFYLEVPGEPLQKGIPAVLRGIVALSSSMLSGWGMRFTNEGGPQLMYKLRAEDTSTPDVLKKYMVLECEAARGCVLLARAKNGGRQTAAQDPVAFEALKALGIANAGRLSEYKNFCLLAQSGGLRALFEPAFKKVTAQCGPETGIVFSSDTLRDDKLKSNCQIFLTTLLDQAVALGQ